MIDKSVMQQLLSFSPIENKQYQNKHFYPDLANKYLNKNQQVLVINHKLLSHRPVYISKHNHFAPYPLHQHNFVEINYMLRGKCQQIINGIKINLLQGDLLLMDKDCQHQIGRLNKSDLLINLVFNNQNISFNFLNQLNMRKKDSLVYEFLLNISLKKHNQQSFIIFPNNADITQTMDDLINEYYLHRTYSTAIIKNYFDILLAKIIRYYPMPDVSQIDRQHYQSEKQLINILHDISKNYQTITLTKLAQKYNYSSSYLSNLIKEKTGSNFAQLKVQSKLASAASLLSTTSYPISQICEMVGEKNKTSFYHQFQKHYHCLPAEYRRQKQYI